MNVYVQVIVGFDNIKISKGILDQDVRTVNG